MYEKSVSAERLHGATTLIGVFASLATPVAAGIATTNTGLGAWARPVTLVIGLIGATAVAINQILRTGPRWRLYRASYEDLAAEGWPILTLPASIFGWITLNVLKNSSRMWRSFYLCEASAICRRSPPLKAPSYLRSGSTAK
jgi:Protein of unknown function (DUF4231)